MNWSSIRPHTCLGKILRIPLRLIPPDAVLPIVAGPLRGSQWVVGSSLRGCWLGSYEEPKQRLIASFLRPGTVFFDLGANVGFYSLLAARKGCRVVAFEPLPSNLAFLRRHIVLNHLTSVEVVEAAVCDRDGTAAFAIDGHPSQTRLADAGGIFVLNVALDSLSLPPPDVLKIDIEGAEYDALCGGKETITKSFPVVFLATHGDTVHRRCCDLLAGWGYKLTRISADDELLALPPGRG